ncbi:cobyrinate a,c-diamide synthase [Hymenobacter frigidus]|nr:cobyrinate a,c-diamide synthase [Hymenobacter frigidus]
MPLPSSRFLIAAPSSGSGKTTLTLGLLRALRNRGLTVQPFKCGPDYLDTLHHGTAAGVPSLNLDTFMASEAHVAETYARYAAPADVAVVEGVMGLFDGADRMRASSAAVAELLDLPVVLVVNAKAMAYSVAPLLFGFKNFYPGIRLVGAIFNFVNSASHYQFLRDACQDVGVEALGYLPYNPQVAIPSRHLGLSIDAGIQYEAIIGQLADMLPQTVDLDRLLEITRGAAPVPAAVPAPVVPTDRPRRFAVARDAAFTFTYHQNLQVLAQLGEVTYFSPLTDAALPPATDLLYLPGGYPELLAEGLSRNAAMRASVAAYCQRGGATYAECGGLMYLGQTLTDAQGRTFPMAGVLPCTTSLENSKLTLGYRTAQWNGMTLQGHEFHYSHLTELKEVLSGARVTNAKGVEVPAKVYRQHNTIASYLHLYWAENPAFINWLLSLPANP